MPSPFINCLVREYQDLIRSQREEADTPTGSYVSSDAAGDARFDFWQGVRGFWGEQHADAAWKEYHRRHPLCAR